MENPIVRGVQRGDGLVDGQSITEPGSHIGYLTNQYPKASHSFIRREILALEGLGWSVKRYAMRIPTEEIVDPVDRQEADKTRSLVDAGMPAMATALAQMAASRPVPFARALRAATRLARRSDVGMSRHLVYLAEAALLVQWCEQDGVTHLHTHFGTNSAEVALLSHYLGGPSYSLTIHGPEEFDRAPLLGIAEKIGQAVFVCTVSSFGRSQACRLVPTEHWDRIHVVHCGLDDEWFNGATVPIPGGNDSGGSNSGESSSDPRQLVCVARLSEQKGHGILLAALAKVAESGRDFHMTLVGDGELRPEVEAQIQSSGLADKVTITGWASEDEVKTAINASVGFVLPSFAEGLPVVIMEALAAGRPVISTYVAGIPELVRPGISGWLVPAGSVDLLVDAVCELLDAPIDQLETLGIAGRKAVKDQHRAKTEAAKIAALFPEAPS